MIELRLTTPQRPIIQWVIDRLVQEGVPEDRLPVFVSKGRVEFHPDKEVLSMVYHLLTYELRALWKEDPESEAVPGRPVTGDSIAHSLVIYADIQSKVRWTEEELEELRGRSFHKVKGRPSRAALAKIREVLEAAVDEIGPELHEQLKAAYLEEADRSLTDFLELAKDPARKGSPSYNDRAWYGVKEYIRYHEEKARKAGIEAPWSWTWETARRHPKLFSADHEHALRKAKDAYESARRGFIEKNVSKLASIMGKREDLVDFRTRFRYLQGVFVGTMTLELSDAVVEAELSLKYVIRTIPKVTPYFQYPLNFTRAVVQGEELRRPSEEELVVALKGTEVR